jgi:hypothetical protein
MFVSTLARYVDAAGGRLVVMADIEGKLVELTRIGRGGEGALRSVKTTSVPKRVSGRDLAVPPPPPSPALRTREGVRKRVSRRVLPPSAKPGEGGGTAR